MAQINALTVFVVLGCAASVLGDVSNKHDGTMSSVGRSCMNKFETVLVDLYGDDKACQDGITNAWSSPGKNCPSTKIGSDVHKCLSKSEASRNRWVEFIKECEVMNVALRDETSTVAVESEAAAPPPSSEAASDGAPPGGKPGGEEAKPSCFPAWEEWTDFEMYLEGKKSGSAQLAVATVLAVVAACICTLVLDSRWL